MVSIHARVKRATTILYHHGPLVSIHARVKRATAAGSPRPCFNPRPREAGD